METLEQKIEPIVSNAPVSAQARFNNALLNLAVNKIVAAEGPSLLLVFCSALLMP